MSSESKLIKTKLDIYFKKEIIKLNKIKASKEEKRNKTMGGGGLIPAPSSSTHIF